MEAVHGAVLTITNNLCFKTYIKHFQLKIDIFAVIKIRSLLHRRIIVIMHVHSNVYIYSF